MKSTVYYMDLRATYKDNLLKKLARLLDAAGLARVVKERDLVAVKLHFGELGNTAFIRPVFIREIVQEIREAGGVPFLTDSNTLYRGTRSDAPRHLKTAIRNGFTYAVVDAPVIIADGLRGGSDIAVAIHQKRFKHVFIASEIAHADTLVSVAHFKGHELTGFAGTLKNVGMGCASRKGKMAQHSTVSPKVKKKACIGCGDCVAHCPRDAVSLEEDKAVIDSVLCVGCGECILICPTAAVGIRWNQTIPVFLENMVEHAQGALKAKAGKVLFLNFLIQVSPSCDCAPYNDAPIVRDIGVVAAEDPVAIDQASVDLVNQEPSVPGSCLNEQVDPGGDKFKRMHPKVDWSLQLEYAQRLGLGTRHYDLVKI
jgi:uncharacterized Fe-S center protein